jgi:hypothetical protein
MQLSAKTTRSGSQYTARICWSLSNWMFPTGVAALYEKGSYVVKAGFGHEEWLFNFV